MIEGGKNYRSIFNIMYTDELGDIMKYETYSRTEYINKLEEIQEDKIIEYWHSFEEI